MKLKQDSLNFILGPEGAEEMRPGKSGDAIRKILQILAVPIALAANLVCRVPARRRLRVLVTLVLVLSLTEAALSGPRLRQSWIDRQQAAAVALCTRAAKTPTAQQAEEYLSEAESYNDRLSRLVYPPLESAAGTAYETLLDPEGLGMMGSIVIDGTEMPVFHDTDDADAALLGAIHVRGTSLPVGGKSTLCALRFSGKTAEAVQMLEAGDTFTLRVMERSITYRVTARELVDAENAEALNVTAGEDLCTLVICAEPSAAAPRLLVRAARAID